MDNQNKTKNPVYDHIQADYYKSFAKICDIASYLKSYAHKLSPEEHAQFIERLHRMQEYLKDMERYLQASIPKIDHN